MNTIHKLFFSQSILKGENAYKEIDDLVYELYGITEEEREMIEGEG